MSTIAPNPGQTFVVDGDSIHIPPWVVDHTSFRRWQHDDDFPQDRGRVCYLAGEIWIDMSKEQIFSHNQVKGEFNRVIGNLTKKSKRGRYFADGVLYTSIDAELTSRPDGAFALHESKQSGRIQLVEGAQGGFVELLGSLDMALEIISDSSVRKDTKVLLDLYWRAGVREYWLVDARTEPLRFDIFQHGDKGFRPVRRQKGWVKSNVFGVLLNLTASRDDFGNPDFTLETKYHLRR